MKKILFLMVIPACILSCKQQGEVRKEAVLLRGSDTEFELVKTLCHGYAGRCDFQFEITGGGSSEGIDGLINGEVDIANSSRPITKKEKILAQENGITTIPVVIAIDAIAIITNPKLGIDSLSTLQLQQIFTGNISNWKQVGGPDLRIRLYGRNNRSGTQQFIQSRFVNKQKPRMTTIELATNDALVKAISHDIAGISYVGAGFITNRRGKPEGSVWTMLLYSEGDVAYSPHQQMAVLNGQYPLTRPLYQYFNGVPGGKMLRFLSFELSEKGQQIIRDFGYYPITSQYVSANKQNGIHF